MLESKYLCKQSYSTNDLQNYFESSDSYVFKKFINAAIYVEKTIKKLAPDMQNYEKHLSETIKIMKTKRCSCYIDADSCPCHPTMASGDGLRGSKSDAKIDFSENLKKLKNINRILTKPQLKKKISKQPQPNQITKSSDELQLSKSDEELTPRAVPSETKLELNRNQIDQKITNDVENEEKFLAIEDPQNEIVSKNHEKNVLSHCESEGSSTSSSTLCSGSQVTVRRIEEVHLSESKASLSSLTSFTPSENNSVRQWLSKKLEEEKKRQAAQRKKEKKKQLEREKILAKERENFRMWLAAKKKEEDKKKAEIERQEQLDQLRELEKQKRNLENQIRYQIWLKRKEEANIEKKNKEQLQLLQAKIESERRTIANQKAFEEWLEFSKNKPKPLPFNRGLDSLRSSLSVTYINPIPWVPNIDLKPASK